MPIGHRVVCVLRKHRLNDTLGAKSGVQLNHGGGGIHQDSALERLQAIVPVTGFAPALCWSRERTARLFTIRKRANGGELNIEPWETLHKCSCPGEYGPSLLRVKPLAPQPPWLSERGIFEFRVTEGRNQAVSENRQADFELTRQ